jgi:vancomycin permeability regulator SanA
VAAPRKRRWSRLVRSILILGVVLALLSAIPYAWVRVAASPHLYDEGGLANGRGPYVDVALVLGAEVDPDHVSPQPVLRGRLDTAAQLYQSGNVRVLLVSGDAGERYGDEPAVMTHYLVARGVATARIVQDPYGLDTYDSCRRARDVYGLRRLLIVTQPYHLARAVTLCRALGIDAIGVGARCDGCDPIRLSYDAFRDYFASTKAAFDVLSNRGPAVPSPPSSAVQQALSS